MEKKEAKVEVPPRKVIHTTVPDGTRQTTYLINGLTPAQFLTISKFSLGEIRKQRVILGFDKCLN